MAREGMSVDDFCAVAFAREAGLGPPGTRKVMGEPDRGADQQNIGPSCYLSKEADFFSCLNVFKLSNTIYNFPCF